MLLKVIRENETTYYAADKIRKFTVSPVYGQDDLFDVAVYVDSQSEIVKVFDSPEKAEEFVRKIYKRMDEGDSSEIIDLSRF